MPTLWHFKQKERSMNAQVAFWQHSRNITNSYQHRYQLHLGLAFLE
jgi:hypothetical protein